MGNADRSNHIISCSWSELGYRRLGTVAQSTAGGANLLEMLRQTGGYEVEKPDWIRHSLRTSNRQYQSAEIVRRIDSSWDPNTEDLSFVDSYFDWADRTLPKDIPQLTASRSDLEHIVADARDANPWSSAYLLASAIG